MSQEIKDLIKQFEGREVKVIVDENGEPLFEVYSVGMALGYFKSNTVKGKTYYQCRKDRVRKIIEGADIEPLVHGGLIYFTEEMLYDFMLEARTEKCRAFRKWVTSEVLPQIRKYGAYINEDENKVDKEYLKFARGTIKETFRNCPVESIGTLFKEAMGFYSENKNKLNYYTDKGTVRSNRKYRKDKKLSVAESKLEICNTIKATLLERDRDLISNGIIGCSREINVVIVEIERTIKDVNKAIARGKLASNTKTIGKLKAELEAKEVEHNQILQIYQPKDDDYITIEEYPISKNSLYDAVLDYNTGEPRFVCSNKYNKWKHWFKIKADEAGLREAFSHINFDEDVFISYKVIAPYGYDVSNLINPLQDILADYFDCMSDQKFHICNTEIEGYYSDIKDGSIKIYLCNKGDF